MARIANANLKASTLSTDLQFIAAEVIDQARPQRSSRAVEVGIENSEGRGSGPLNKPILSRIAEGDRAAVDECLEEFGDLVWSIARRLSTSGADAEDAAQEVFLELWQKADRYDPEIASEATFIAMIARRRLIDRLRKNRTRVGTESLDLDIFSNQSDSTEDAELRDEAAKAAKCLGRLPDQQQQVIALSVHQGASHRVISERLNIPLGTVKTFARRGLIQIRDCMNRRLTPSVERGVS